MNKKIIAAQPVDDQPPEIEIVRDAFTRHWCVQLGSHQYETPCTDAEDAKAWIKSRANGRIIVTVRV